MQFVENSPILETETSHRVDLAFAAAKKRQSPRTGFIHFFYGNDSAADTIPLYENICYGLALLHQKKAEAALEARDLLLRLLAFQTEDGNFPVYLHDYPRCFGFLLGLKIVPLLLQIHSFSSLGAECREKIGLCLERLFSFYEVQKTLRPLAPLWAYRYEMGKAVWKKESLPIDLLDSSQFSASDWWEYWVTKQFEAPPTCTFYHAQLKRCIGPFLFERAQEGREPALALIDWACGGEGEAASPQMGLVALQSLQVQKKSEDSDPSFVLLTRPETGSVLFLWKSDSLHSLVFESLQATLSVQSVSPHSELSEFRLDLPTTFELNRDDLFEVAFYIDASPGIDLWINDRKGTAFCLGDWIQIRSANTTVSFCFNLVEGEGDFCGHIYRSNRSSQRLATQGESYDWKIGLRTLRRSQRCAISVQLKFQETETGSTLL